jgi:hypothetical protein
MFKQSAVSMEAVIVRGRIGMLRRQPVVRHYHPTAGLARNDFRVKMVIIKAAGDEGTAVAVEGRPGICRTLQFVVAATDATIVIDRNMKIIARWMTMEGCKHGTHRSEIGRGVGKILRDTFEDGL